MKKLLLLFAAIITFALSAAAQNQRVEGQVMSADGEPLVGATVVGVGTQKGAATDIDGNFSLVLPASVKKLNVSYVGMETKEVAITPGFMTITLESTNVLDEVITVAYGTAKKSAYTGSASVLKADQIENTLVTDVTSALAGTVAGVQLQSYNGAPGSEPTVRIRGVGSINASTTPLYVVDGIPYDGGMTSINPSDVESITVLKDAASAALYGARGANGVILVTTKSGRQGDAVVTVDARWGANSREIPNYETVNNPWAYTMAIYNSRRNYAYYSDKNYMGDPMAAHAYAVSGLNAGPGSNVLGYQVFTIPTGQSLIGTDGRFNPNATLGYNDGTHFITPDNWEDLTYHNGFRQEYNVSISGGNDRLKYMLSGAYLSDEGIIQESSFKRFSTRASVEYQAKKWLKVGSNISYTYENRNYPQSQTSSGYSGNASYAANFIAPIYPFYLRDSQGQIMRDAATGNKLYDYGMKGLGLDYSRAFLAGANPTGELIYNKSEYLDDNFNGKWFAQINPIDGLTITGTAGYWMLNRRFNYLANRTYGQMSQYGGSVQQDVTRYHSLNLQALANYRKTFAEHHSVDILLGYETYSYGTSNVGGTGQNLYNNSNHTLSNVIDKKSFWGSEDAYATRGIFARVNYDFDTKYYASVSYRRDASSRFHPDHRWGNFYSLSAAWDISKENFMQEFTNVDMLKAKVSFGQQGNDALGNDYPYVDQYIQSGSNGVWSVGELSYKGNPDLTWETSNSFNAGFDFSFFQGKVDGTIEYFQRQTSDMLYYKPTAPSLGYSSIPMNIGSMRNYGMEFELRYNPINLKNITWDINFNLTYVRNKVIKLAPELNGTWISGSRIYEEGKSMYQLYLVKYAGVDQENGLPLYWAKDADGVEFTTTDFSVAQSGSTATGAQANRQSTGNILPPVYGGIGTSLNVYGVDFSIQCGYQLGGKIMDYGYQLLMHNGTDAGTAMHKDALKAWTAENPSTTIPRLDSTWQYMSNTSDRWLVSAKYFSINNISVGYTLPSKFTNRFGVSQLRIYGAADNVAIWSARKGLDPRQSYVQSYAGSYSALRAISGGVKVVF